VASSEKNPLKMVLSTLPSAKCASGVTAAPNSIIVRFLDKVLEAIQAVEIQAFAERFDSSNGTANHTTSYVIFYL